MIVFLSELLFFSSLLIIYKKCIFILNIFKSKAAPENSVIVMHGCAHNPSGMDINLDQWSLLSKLFKVNNNYKN